MKRIGIALLTSLSVFSFGGWLTPQLVLANPGQKQLETPGRVGSARDLRDEADLQLRLGGRAEQKGQLEKAVSHWLTALRLYEQINDIEGIGLTYDYLGLSYVQLGLYKQAEDALRRRLNIARDRQDFQGQIFALNNLGGLLIETNRVDGAEEAFNDALSIARSVGNNAGEGLSLSNLGLVAAARGDYYQAIKRYEAALVFRRRVSDPVGEANTLNNLGDAYSGAQDYRMALDAYKQAQFIAKDSHDPKNLFRAYEGISHSYRALENTKLAFQKLNEWVNFAQEQENLAQELKAVTLAAQIYQEVGDKKQAEVFYNRAIELAIALGDDSQEAWLKNQLSQIIYQR